MHRHPIRYFAQGAAVALLANVSAHASDEGISTTFSGFGTVAADVASSSRYQFVANPSQFKGASREPDAGLDSRIGLQGVVKFDPQFSLTAQALSERRGSDDFGIGTEWLFGQFTPTPGLDLRLGRVVLPTFLISDSRNVGYAVPWLRSPNEVYGALSFTNLDGLQGLWRVNAGSATLTSQVSYGKTSAKVNAGSLGVIDAQARNVLNLGFTAEAGDFTVRVAQTRLTVPVALPLGPTTSIQFDNQDKFLSIGMQYDNGSALVLSEWARRRENDVPGLGLPISATTAWYVAAGWRFGTWTPMLRYAAQKNDGSLVTFPGKPSLGASLRYDAFRNVALKFQVDRYDASSPDAFTAPSATAGTKVTVVGFGADFVF